MDIHFLAHSGFLVEMPSGYLLFDWWQGALPPLGDKPLYIFASHSHHDHLNQDIFQKNATFFLGHDITPPAGVHAHVLSGNQMVTLDGITVETLPSTDEGVAFIVTIDGATLYHAGDLHWWHWEGEPDPWNGDMERNFKTYIAPLAERKVDVAFVPLDPRLGAAQDWGLCHVLDLANVTHVVPMHQWGDDAPTAQFCQDHPKWEPLICPMTPGQVLSI